MSKTLFSNGTEYMVWCENNCYRCAKNYDFKSGQTKCDIEHAIALASVTDGTLLCEGENSEEEAQELAKRLGWDGESDLPWNCPEFQAKEVSNE